MFTLNQPILTQEVQEKKEIISSQIATPTKASKQAARDALVYAFCLLLEAVHDSYNSAVTKAKELGATRNNISNLIAEEKNYQDQAVLPKLADNFTETLQGLDGNVYHYYLSKAPNVVTVNGVNRVEVQGLWFNTSRVQWHDHQGVTMWSKTIPVKPNTNGCFEPNPTYIAQGFVTTKPPITALMAGYHRHDGFQPISQQEFVRINMKDATMDKARSYLTNKINTLKQLTQAEETELGTTTDLQGMITQQGMKITGLLEQLSQQISQM